MSNIEIQQPQPFDLVDEVIQVAGQSVAFEATVQYRITEGHDQLDGFFTGGGAISVLQFQTTITGVGATAMKLPRMFLSLFEFSAEDGTEINTTTVPLIYGPLLIPGYEGWQPYTIQVGDTLSSIAQDRYGDATLFPVLQAANQHMIPNPDLIFPGQSIRIPQGDV